MKQKCSRTWNRSVQSMKQKCSRTWNRSVHVYELCPSETLSFGVIKFYLKYTSKSQWDKRYRAKEVFVYLLHLSTPLLSYSFFSSYVGLFPYSLLSSPNIVRVMKLRKMRLIGHIARMGERRNIYNVLVGKPEGKRSFGRPRRRWEDNIKMGLQEVGCRGMDWIELTQDRDRWRALVNGVIFLTSWEPVTFLRRALLHGVSNSLIRAQDYRF